LREGCTDVRVAEFVAGSVERSEKPPSRIWLEDIEPALFIPVVDEVGNLEKDNTSIDG